MFIITAALFLTLMSYATAVESRGLAIVQFEHNADPCNEYGAIPYGRERCKSWTSNRGRGGGSVSKPPAPAAASSAQPSPTLSSSSTSTRQQMLHQAAAPSPIADKRANGSASTTEPISPSVGEQLSDISRTIKKANMESSNEVSHAHHANTASDTSGQQRYHPGQEAGGEGEAERRSENREGNEGERQNYILPPQVSRKDGGRLSLPMRDEVSEHEFSRALEMVKDDAGGNSSLEESASKGNGVIYNVQAVMLYAALGLMSF